MPLAPGMRLDGFTENTPFTGNAGEKGTGASASNGQQADTKGATEMDSEADLFAAYLPSTPNPSTRISVPTRGVFAESVIGGCNGCEQIDDTRNWRYWEHPLPEQPTAIGQIDLGSRRAEKPFAVPQMPASPIQQGEPLPAPAPATLQQIVDILGAANAFRDLAGLSGTQQNAREALNASFETTQKAYEIATNAMIEGAKAAASAYAQAPIGDVSKLKSAVSKDVKAGRVTPEQGRATIAKINDAVADGLGGKTPSGLFDNPDVTSAISAAAVRGASLSMEQGNAKVDVGMAPEESPATPKRRAPWPLSLLSARQAQSAPLPPTANLSFTLLAEAYPTQPRAA